MDEQEWLARRFEEQRPRLRAVAYRMLGSTHQAEDAVQEAWLRLCRSDAVAIENLEAWLVTTVGRIALNQLRSQRNRREAPLEHAPERADGPDPADEAMLADSVGLALLVVLETLTPAERLAYVLHDMFSVPFDEIAAILERSPESARQLASRGRRRIRGQDGDPPDGPADREVVDAFLAAARNGDFAALVAVLDPDVVGTVHLGRGEVLEVRGAETVARRAASARRPGLEARAALVEGRPGWTARLRGTAHSVGMLTIEDGLVTELDIVVDPDLLARVEVADYPLDRD
jgi:RNA polymerase sigma factor (sigma-70 family)